jgi:phosphonoacetaldehyde hydrolase
MTQFKAVVFDWAGTVVDFGSFAPMGVFVEAFAEFGVEVSVAQARAPMGMPKRDHIAAMMAELDIATRWAQHHGARPGKAEIDRVYEVFVPMNEKVVAKYATLVPGGKEAIDALRGMG